MRITIISDTHGKHNQITKDLPGGDLIVHAGDISSMGHEHEINNFCKWFDGLDNYNKKIFIAGNHDWGFQNNIDKTMEIVNSYKTINYLQDNFLMLQIGDNPEIKIYGTPWQPFFYNWAFNLPRNGIELEEKWSNIPQDVDILITHCPSFGYLDKVIGKNENLGCKKLSERISELKPKIFLFGHIHSGYGYVFNENTHYFNSSVINEKYIYEYKPFTVDWDPKTNDILFV